MDEPIPRISRAGKVKRKLNKDPTNNLGERSAIDTPDNDEILDSLKKLEDDTIEVNNASLVLPASQTNEITSTSTPVGTVFMEVRGGFQPLNCRGLEQPLPIQHESSAKQLKILMSDLAILYHDQFSKMCQLSHGLLAGIALSHCFVIYSLSPSHQTWEDFVEHYTFLAHGFQTIFFFFNVICVVSIFDRYDLANMEFHYLSDILSGKLGILTIFLYPVTLLMTLSVTNIDDRLGLFQHTNSTLWWEEFDDGTTYLESWRSVSLVRSVGIIFAWLLYTICSEDNQLRKHLKEVT